MSKQKLCKNLYFIFTFVIKVAWDLENSDDSHTVKKNRKLLEMIKKL